MKNFLIAMAVIMGTVMCAPAYANVSFGPTVLGAGDATNSSISNGTALMLIDLDDDGWDGTPYTAQSMGVNNSTSWLWDEDDMLLDMTSIGVAYSTPGLVDDLFANISVFDSNGDPTIASWTGSDWYVGWFDVAYDASAIGPGAGVDYGFLNMGDVSSADGQTLSPIIMAAGPATLHTVPEPIAYILMMIGGGMVGIRRRFSRDKA